MRTYDYTALDPAGEPVKGRLKAAHLTSALATLSSQDLRQVKIERVRSRFLPKRKKVSRSEVLHFTRQLSTFSNAGVSMVRAIDGIQAETTNDTFSEVLLDVTQRLRSGERFSEAFAAHPKVFPQSYTTALRSAELTGRLGTVLEQLSTFMERDLETRKRIRAALTYPSVVMVTAIAAVFVLVLFSLPKFAEFFESLSADLPLPTRILLWASGLVGTFWPLILALLVAVPVGVSLLLRRPGGRAWWDRTVLRIPVLGDMVRTLVIERFCLVFGAMLSAGVPVYDAVSVSADATNNGVYRSSLLTARDAMLRGEGIAGPISRTDLFPANLCQMIRVGEESGDVARQLEVAGRHYSREAGYKIDRFTSLFEPAVLLLMAGVVGFIAIALVSAMYGIFNQIEGF